MARLTDTISGAIATFRTPGKQDIHSLKVHFTPVQEGTGDPSPENVRPISGWTGVEMYRTGKNLAEKIYGYNSVGGNATTTSITTDTTGNVVTSVIAVKAGLKYLMSYSGTGTQSRYFWFDRYPIGTGAISIGGQYAVKNVVATAPENAKYMFIVWTRTELQETIGNVQVEQAETTPTAYSPYTGTTLPLDWASSAGTVYGGYVDLVSGEVVAEYYKITLDGENVKANRAYEQNGNYGCGYVYVSPSGLSAKYKNGVPTNIWCENVPLYIGVSAIPEPPYVYAPLAGALYLVMYFAKAADHPELADNTARINYGNEWLKSNPITVVYQLATPTLLTTLTPTALKTLIGTNNIWSNANGNVDVEYDFAESREMMEARKRVMAAWKKSPR